MTNKIRRMINFLRENRYFVIAFAFLAIAAVSMATVFAVDNNPQIEGISLLARILINAIGIPVALVSLWCSHVAGWYIEDQLADERRRALR